MVFIDTVRFLQAENLPLLATAIDLNSRVLAFQLQNGRIYLVSVSKIYEWEDNLRESILRKEYINPRSPDISYVLGTFALQHSLSTLQFSQIPFKLAQVSPNSNKKNVVPVTTSKDNPHKKIKITILSNEPTSGQVASIECPFLVLGTQEGLLYVIATKPFSPETSKELSVVVKMYPSFQLPISILCWHNDILVIGFLDNTMKLYSLTPSSDFSNYSLKLLSVFQNSQLPWRIEALNDKLAVYNRFECNFIDFKRKDVKAVTFKFSQEANGASQTGIISSQTKQIATQMTENSDIKKDDEFFWILMMTRASRVGTHDGKYTLVVSEKDSVVASQIVKKVQRSNKNKKKRVTSKSTREDPKDSQDAQDSEEEDSELVDEDSELPSVSMNNQNLSIVSIEDLSVITNYPLETYAFGWGFSPFLYYTSECSSRISEAHNSKKLETFFQEQKELSKSYRYVIIFMSELQVWEFVPIGKDLEKEKAEGKEVKQETAKLLLRIRNIYKSYLEFCWIDPFRLLFLDDRGRVELYAFSSKDLGFPCERF